MTEAIEEFEAYLRHLAQGLSRLTWRRALLYLMDLMIEAPEEMAKIHCLERGHLSTESPTNRPSGNSGNWRLIGLCSHSPSL
jgi:hypothetical protein